MSINAFHAPAILGSGGSPPAVNNFVITVDEFTLAIVDDVPSLNYLFPNSSPYFNGNIPATYPDISAVDGTIVFSGQLQDFSGICTIAKTDATGVVVSDLYTAGGLTIFPVSPAFSQDGTKIVFSEWDQTTSPDTFNIYTMNADGSGLIKIWTDNSGVFFGATQAPRFNPDGTKIVFQTRDPTESFSILNTMNSDGTGAAPLLDLSGSSISLTGPDWNVNNVVLFATAALGVPGLSTCDNAGGSVTTITLDWGGETLDDISNPRRKWGDTATFAFLADSASFTYVMQANSDGSGTTATITNSGAAPVPELFFGAGVFAS